VVAGLNTGRPASWNFVPAADTEPLLGRDDLYAFQRRARLDSILDEHHHQQEQAEHDADPRHPRD
jgi:hypothetical protein